MLPFRYQLIGHLCVGVVVGFLLSLTFIPVKAEIQQKTTPFVTQENMLAVSILIHKNSPPEIVKVQSLTQGRISIVQPGDYTLVLQDKANIKIYELPFRVLFLQPGDPPLSTDTVHMILVVPNSKDVNKIIITSPQGSADFELKE